MIDTVYFVPTTHHDLGYTHLIEDLFPEYVKYYEAVLTACDRTADYPPEAQYRYTVEEFWSLDYFLHHTTEEKREKLGRYVREGRIEISAVYANLIDGICSPEELARSLYPAKAFARSLGVELRSAALTDMPGMGDGTIAALSAAGIRYLFAGFPLYFRWGDPANGKKLPLRHEYWDPYAVNPWGHPSAFRWRALSGGEMFVWFQDGYGWFGDDAEPIAPHDTYEEIEQRLSGYLSEMEEKGVPYSVMRYIDHGLDNERPRDGICDIVKRWNETHSDVRLVIATNAMFFEALEQDIRSRSLPFPVLQGDMPHTDYTTLALSDAAVTSKNTRTKEQALGTEMWQTLSGGSDTALFGELYRDLLLYDEHCFGLGYPYRNKNEYNRLMKIQYAYAGATLGEQAREKLLPPEEDAYSWFSPAAGTGVCEFLTQAGSGPLELGKDAVLQYDEVREPLLPTENAPEDFGLLQPGQKLFRGTAVLSSEAVGTFPAETGKPFSGPSAVLRTENVLENRYYRLEYGPEGILGLYDREFGRPVSEKGLGTLLFRDIRDGSVTTETFRRTEVSRSGPVADSLLFYGSCPGAPEILTEVTLYHTVKRIDLSYRLMLDPTPLRELYAAFPFPGEHPVCTYGGTDGPIRLFRDTVPGGNTNQVAANRFAAVESDGFRTVLAFRDTHTVLFGGLHPTAVSHAHHHWHPEGYCDPFLSEEELTSSRLYSMIAYNNCRTNFAIWQTGEVLLRYSLTSGRDAEPEAFAFCAVQEPVLVRGRLPETRLSLGGDGESLRVLCFKSAEDGNGTILRIREWAGKDCLARLDWQGHRIKKAWLCRLTEEILEPVDPAAVPVRGGQTVTVRLVTAP